MLADLSVELIIAILERVDYLYLVRCRLVRYTTPFADPDSNTDMPLRSPRLFATGLQEIPYAHRRHTVLAVRNRAWRCRVPRRLAEGRCQRVRARPGDFPEDTESLP